jgi:hypothetical protein
MAKRKPDFILGGLLKDGTRYGSRRSNNIGAAWLNDDGSLMLKLDPFVVLEGSREDMILTLFPNTKG